MVVSARAIFKGNFAPALVYVASDEMNILFMHAFPFTRRTEKTNSILAGIASSAVSLSVAKLFKTPLVTSFDSRIIVSPREKVTEYLTWRQKDAWRNHNNAYAYWFFRRKGCTPPEATRKVMGLKTKNLHEILFRNDVNLTQTPAWQRRGILVYKELHQKQVKNRQITRRQLKENLVARARFPSSRRKRGKT